MRSTVGLNLLYVDTFFFHRNLFFFCLDLRPSEGERSSRKKKKQIFKDKLDQILMIRLNILAYYHEPSTPHMYTHTVLLYQVRSILFVILCITHTNLCTAVSRTSKYLCVDKLLGQLS